jgi:hypothetical protein
MYADLNLPPEILIKKSAANGPFAVSLSDSVKRDFNIYILEYTLKDEESLQVTVTSNIGTDLIHQEGNKVQIKFDQASVGKHEISLTSTDTYKKIGTAIGTFELFVNLPPVANFYINKRAVFDPLEYTIDASASYDKDYKFGGGLKNFEFVINNNYKVTNANGILNYIFPAEGNYTISVRVQDTDGVWSVYKTQVVTITK